MQKTPALYGISKSNRNFADPFYWGKNQFNSSFPAALACYMRDQKVPAVYLRHGSKSDTRVSEIGFDDVFGTKLPNAKIFFGFEERFSPFSDLIIDALPSIDLVLQNASTRECLRPLEVKLTTLPDSGTAECKEDEYGSEIVVRSPTMRYVAMSMAKSCFYKLAEVREIFESSCGKVRDWDNLAEMTGKRTAILSALEKFLNAFHDCEKSFLMQPVWKTQGKNPVLAENCLDVFVWSDFALCRLFMDAGRDDGEKISRPLRSALRLSRFLYEVSCKGKVFQKPIYDGMTYDTLNDKEFAVSGAKTNYHMRCSRLTKPIIRKEQIKEIVLGGGQKFLSPERRFDAIIYYSEGLFDE